MPRQRKPDSVKHRLGTFRNDRANKDISGLFLAPDKPDWLCDVAGRYWDATLAQLEDLGVEVHPADGVSLATYANLCARQEKKPESFGANLIGHMRAIQASFGLTAASRATLGIKVGKKREDDEFD